MSAECLNVLVRAGKESTSQKVTNSKVAKSEAGLSTIISYVDFWLSREMTSSEIIITSKKSSVIHCLQQASS